jgi:RNA polymerase sigma factor (sigma-70 family)
VIGGEVLTGAIRTGLGGTGDLPETVEVFDVFFRREFHRLVLFIVQLGSDWAEAEDIAQETMLAAYDQWSAVEHPAAWVRKVAYRGLVRQVPRRRRETVVPQPVGPRAGAVAAVPLDALDFLVDRQAAREILTLIRALPPEQRLVMAWRCDDFTPREIADALGKSEATVRSLLRHARARLRTALGIDGNDWRSGDDGRR